MLNVSPQKFQNTLVNVVEQAGGAPPPEVRWLLVGAIAVVLVSIGLLARTIQASEEVRAVNRSGGRALCVSSVVILLLGLTNLSTVPLLVLLVLLMLAPVFYGFRTWLQLQEPEADTPAQGKVRLGVL